MAERTINEEAGLGPEWKPIDVPPIVPGVNNYPGPVLPASQGQPFLQGSTPPSFQHDVTFVRTEIKSENTPAFSLMPLSISGNPASNAAVSSTAKKIVNAAIAAIPPAPVAVVSTGDGLTHGSLPWEIDPSFIMLRDDFNVRESASGAIGELGWFVTGNTTVGPSVFSVLPVCGAFGLELNSTAANSVAAITLCNYTTNTFNNTFMPLLDYPGWTCTWVFYLGRPVNSAGTPGTNFLMTHTSMYVGLGSQRYSGVPWGPRPPAFIGVRYDTDTTAPTINDTTFWLEATLAGCTNTNTRYNNQGIGGGAFNTGITPTEGKPYRLTVSCAAAGVVNLSFTDGTTLVSTSFTMSPLLVQCQATTSAIENDGHGIAAIYFDPNAFSATNGYIPFGPGSKFVASQFAGGSLAAYNGPHVAYSANAGGGTSLVNFLDTTGGVTGNPIQNYYLSGFPAFTPWASLSNDSTGGTSTTARALFLDFFGFIWNPNLGPNAPGTPDPTKSRYW